MYTNTGSKINNHNLDQRILSYYLEKEKVSYISQALVS